MKVWGCKPHELTTHVNINEKVPVYTMGSAEPRSFSRGESFAPLYSDI